MALGIYNDTKLEVELDSCVYSSSDPPSVSECIFCDDVLRIGKVFHVTSQSYRLTSKSQFVSNTCVKQRKRSYLILNLSIWIKCDWINYGKHICVIVHVKVK